MTPRATAQRVLTAQRVTTHRVSATIVWVLLLSLVVLAMAGCSLRSATTSSSSSTAARSAALAPSPVPTRQLAGDPALAAAVAFERAHCAWTWRQPMASYVAAQQVLATPAYRSRIAAEADPVSWRTEVVAEQQSVTCTVSAAHRLVGAPSTSTRVYTRLTVTEHITSTMGNFTGGQQLVSWLVQLVDGHWLVAVPFSGG